MRDETRAASQAVSACELAELVRDRARMAALREELGALACDVHRRERDLIRRIESGARVEGTVQVAEHRSSAPRWLAVVSDELGGDLVDRIKKVWPVTSWKELVIGENEPMDGRGE